MSDYIRKRKTMLFPTSTECVLQNKAQNSQLFFLTTKPTKPCPLQNKQTNKSRYYFALTKLAKLTKSDSQYYFIVTYTARSSHATTLRSPRYNASKHNPLTGYASACASKNTKHTRKHVEHFNQIESCYVIHDAKS